MNHNVRTLVVLALLLAMLSGCYRISRSGRGGDDDDFSEGDDDDAADDDDVSDDDDSAR